MVKSTSHVGGGTYQAEQGTSGSKQCRITIQCRLELRKIGIRRPKGGGTKVQALHLPQFTHSERSWRAHTTPAARDDSTISSPPDVVHAPAKAQRLSSKVQGMAIPKAEGAWEDTASSAAVGWVPGDSGRRRLTHMQYGRRTMSAVTVLRNAATGGLGLPPRQRPIPSARTLSSSHQSPLSYQYDSAEDAYNTA